MATAPFNLEGIQKFHGWAHASLDLLLNHLATIPPGDYLKEIEGFGFPSLRHQLIHILNCEAFWIHTLQGLPFEDRKPAEFPALADARLLKQQVSRETLTYLTSLTDEQLNSDAELHFADGDTEIRTPALVLHHVLTHAFHHKGQMVAKCRLLGYPAPDTDMNNFA